MHEVLEESLLVGSQQVSLATLDIGTDDAMFTRDTLQLSESLLVPAPRQLELAKRVVVGGQLGSHRIARRARFPALNCRCHGNPPSAGCAASANATGATPEDGEYVDAFYSKN